MPPNRNGKLGKSRCNDINSCAYKSSCSCNFVFEPLDDRSIELAPNISTRFYQSNGNHSDVRRHYRNHGNESAYHASSGASVIGHRHEYSTVCDIGGPTPLRGRHVDEVDIERVQCFFSSRHTQQVIVCRTLANLFTRDSERQTVLAPPATTAAADSWCWVHTGIAVLIVEQTASSRRHRRRVQLALVECGTSFVLWRVLVSAREQYVIENESFHTLTDTAADGGGGTKKQQQPARYGLNFENSECATDFYNSVMKSLESQLVASGQSVRAGSREKSVHTAALRSRGRGRVKSTISQPCAFQHVTRLTQADRHRYYTLRILT